MDGSRRWKEEGSRTGSIGRRVVGRDARERDGREEAEEDSRSASWRKTGSGDGCMGRWMESRDLLEEGRRCKRGSGLVQSWDGSEGDEPIRKTMTMCVSKEGKVIEEELVPIVVVEQVAEAARRVLRLERCPLSFSTPFHFLSSLPPSTALRSPCPSSSRSLLEIRIPVRRGEEPSLERGVEPAFELLPSRDLS